MPSGIVCLLSPFCVCLPIQPGISHPGSGPHGRWDTADWSQRVFSALPRLRLHHHTARWHVRQPLCTHASLGAACRNRQRSIRIHQHRFTYPNNALLLAARPLGSTFARAMIYLWHAFVPRLVWENVEKAVQQWESCPGSYPESAHNKSNQQHIVP